MSEYSKQQREKDIAQFDGVEVECQNNGAILDLGETLRLLDAAGYDIPLYNEDPRKVRWYSSDPDGEMPEDMPAWSVGGWDDASWDDDDPNNPNIVPDEIFNLENPEVAVTQEDIHEEDFDLTPDDIVKAHILAKMTSAGYEDHYGAYEAWRVHRGEQYWKVFSRVVNLMKMHQLNKVMTSVEVAEAFGITDAAVRMAIQRGTIHARQSGSTWLILREDAEKKWRKK